MQTFRRAIETLLIGSRGSARFVKMKSDIVWTGWLVELFTSLFFSSKNYGYVNVDEHFQMKSSQKCGFYSGFWDDLQTASICGVGAQTIDGCFRRRTQLIYFALAVYCWIHTWKSPPHIIEDRLYTKYQHNRQTALHFKQTNRDTISNYLYILYAVF